MAKREVATEMVQFGLILWNSERNYRKSPRDKANQDKLLSLLEPGWRPNVDPVICFPLGNLNFNQEEVSRTMEERKAEHERLRLNTSDPQSAYNLRAFEILFCDGNGKLLTPRYAATSCFGRSGLYPLAVRNFLYKKENGKQEEQELYKDVDPVVKVPAMIRTFENDLERIRFMVQENELPMEGRLATVMEDKLRAAKVFYDNLANEAYMRRNFGDSNGVKLYGICWLDQHFPTLRLIERILLPVNAEGRIPLASVNYVQMQDFCGRSTPERLEKTNKRLANKGQEKSLVTLEELEKYFSDPKADQPLTFKGLDKNVWTELKERSTVQVIKEIAAGHLTQSKDPMIRLGEFAEQLNRCLLLCREGKSAKVLEALRTVLTDEEAAKKAAEEAAKRAAEEEAAKRAAEEEEVAKKAAEEATRKVEEAMKATEESVKKVKRR